MWEGCGAMDRFEMGGYLPLELHQGSSYFENIPAEQILAVNTGRTAIWYGIRSLGVHKVFAPYYYCPDIIAMLEQTGVEISYYRIGADFLPLNVLDEEDAGIILVNYFGVVGEKLLRYSKNFRKVIFDQAHSFYTPPVLEEGVMNVYSCRKFFGVSDGAYLIGKGIEKPELERDVSSVRAGHLLKSVELGTNSAYLESKHNEEVLGEKKLAMSVLTEQILRGTDYEAVAAKRNRNFQYLHQRLKKLQQLEIAESDPVPYAYPLLLDRDIHKELVRERIYVPVLWSQLLERKWNGTLEQRYSANIVPLPLDQRYDEAQLEHMVRIIEACLEEKTGSEGQG